MTSEVIQSLDNDIVYTIPVRDLLHNIYTLSSISASWQEMPTLNSEDILPQRYIAVISEQNEKVESEKEKLLNLIKEKNIKVDDEKPGFVSTLPIMRTVSKEELKELYDKDFPLWAEINLELLKEKVYDFVDWENLLEEIEDMANRHLDACISQLARILEHLYKWDNFKNLAGGEYAGGKWIKSVESARDRIKASFKKYSGLENKLPSKLESAWIDAIVNLREWLRNNNYDPEEFNIPEECPYTYKEAMNRDLRKESL